MLDGTGKDPGHQGLLEETLLLMLQCSPFLLTVAWGRITPLTSVFFFLNLYLGVRIKLDSLCDTISIYYCPC